MHLAKNINKTPCSIVTEVEVKTETIHTGRSYGRKAVNGRTFTAGHQETRSRRPATRHMRRLSVLVKLGLHYCSAAVSAEYIGFSRGR